MLIKREYQNLRTKEKKEFDIEADEDERCPMFIKENGDEWRATNKWSLNVINSSEFFRSAHEYSVKHTAPPLEGDSMPYGIT